MDFSNLRDELSDKEARLRRRVGKIERDLRRPHDADSQERATERLNEPVLEALDEHVLAEIEAIRAAVQRTGRDGTPLHPEEGLTVAEIAVAKEDFAHGEARHRRLAADD